MAQEENKIPTTDVRFYNLQPPLSSLALRIYVMHVVKPVRIQYVASETTAIVTLKSKEDAERLKKEISITKRKLGVEVPRIEILT